MENQCSSNDSRFTGICLSTSLMKMPQWFILSNRYIECTDVHSRANWHVIINHRPQNMHRMWSSSSPFIFSQNTGCSSDAHQLQGQTFRCCGWQLLNTLPSSLRLMTSYGQFRRYVKAHSFRAHCEVRFFAPYKYSHLLTYLIFRTSQPC